MAAADASAASAINSSLVQSVQNSTSLATCLGVSLLVLSVRECVQACQLLSIPQVTTAVQMTVAAGQFVCCLRAFSGLRWG